MEDHDKERFLHYGEHVMEMHEHLRALLHSLPIPVVVPDFIGDDGPNPEAVFALDRARHLIEDEPISRTRQTSYQDLIIEWMTAYEMLVLTRVAGPAPWRLDCVEFAISRFTVLAEMIESGEVDEIDEP
ncbi:hypothetical protein JHN59_38165 [Streptomyces sp. MBT49]|uniref:hypothetical protein n=1 Tax=Streptomyces sp. MBT49 TaxID=1488380 RepID=UPI00190A7A2E|nr:hypothetical protein [Streptomyces sp. MBT49]MBK3630525.1 hypothetical protein [Streptomyces sp. MBT49]